jgi:hypothetical protein
MEANVNVDYFLKFIEASIQKQVFRFPPMRDWVAPVTMPHSD